MICDPEINKICSYVLTNQKYSQNQSLFNTGTQMHFTAVAPYTVIILFVIHPTVITILLRFYCTQFSSILWPLMCFLFSDINECQSGNGGCNHHCINTAGSFYCKCDPGFEFTGSNRKKCRGKILEEKITCDKWSVKECCDLRGTCQPNFKSTACFLFL